MNPFELGYVLVVVYTIAVIVQIIRDELKRK